MHELVCGRIIEIIDSSSIIYIKLQNFFACVVSNIFTLVVTLVCSPSALTVAFDIANLVYERPKLKGYMGFASMQLK